MPTTQQKIDKVANHIVLEFFTACVPPSLDPKIDEKVVRYHWDNLRSLVQKVIRDRKFETHIILKAVEPAKKHILSEFAEYLI